MKIQDQIADLEIGVIRGKPGITTFEIPLKLAGFLCSCYRSLLRQDDTIRELQLTAAASAVRIKAMKVAMAHLASAAYGDKAVEVIEAAMVEGFKQVTGIKIVDEPSEADEVET